MPLYGTIAETSGRSRGTCVRAPARRGEVAVGGDDRAWVGQLGEAAGARAASAPSRARRRDRPGRTSSASARPSSPGATSQPGLARTHQLGVPADARREDGPIRLQRLEDGVRPAFPARRGDDDVVLGEQRPDLRPAAARRAVVMRSSPSVISSSVACIELPVGPDVGVAADERERRVVARAALERADQVEHALAALEPPDVQQLRAGASSGAAAFASPPPRGSAPGVARAAAPPAPRGRSSARRSRGCRRRPTARGRRAAARAAPSRSAHARRGRRRCARRAARTSPSSCARGRRGACRAGCGGARAWPARARTPRRGSPAPRSGRGRRRRRAPRRRSRTLAAQTWW